MPLADSKRQISSFALLLLVPRLSSSASALPRTSSAPRSTDLTRKLWKAAGPVSLTFTGRPRGFASLYGPGALHSISIQSPRGILEADARTLCKVQRTQLSPHDFRPGAKPFFPSPLLGGPWIKHDQTHEKDSQMGNDHRFGSRH